MAAPPVSEADVAVLVLQYLNDNGFGRAAAAFQR
jgi:LisH